MRKSVGIVIVIAALLVLGVAIFINAQRKEEKQWQDGTYTARSAPAEGGDFGEITLVISDKKIVRAEYEEIDGQRRLKGPDYPYQAGPQSHQKYEENLIQTQDPDKVDVITGATETHQRFKEAAQNALRKAEEGDESKPPALKPPLPPVPSEEATEKKQWRDGTYTARTEPDAHGYHGEIEIVIADGKIEKVKYDEKDAEGQPKGPEYPYPLGPASEDEFEERLLETQDPEKVDVISGATETWERFKETATAALKKAE